ncbi:sensor histidine kinase [Roseovarius faecimaris]|uniref:histidine kinase n=1 Tax=Roseovarius faecimaris TaxID=2494550 RepID=A0A6I6IPT1_9RHOB|nr:HAMP domain-containing sensor histidine kinase [Roseovarius faecimaris]QGX97216.1 sensor histidine kinase [Roseovarius faecimaris]
MAILDVFLPAASGREPDDRLLQNLKDYTSISFALIWQRQAIFIAASLLTAFYFDAANAAVFYCTIVFCEIQDIVIARRVKRLEPHEHEAIRTNFIWIMLNTMLSSGAICLYAVSVALKQDTGGHFTPLFFLFAAALFAAMNNHQLVKVLTLRLAMYGISFLFIVCFDIWVTRPSLESELWLQFFTIVFVMYFLIDCSIVYLKLYRKNLAQLEALRQEHELTKAAYVAKTQFISTVSHELRTPLTSIKGSLDLINCGALGEVPEKMKTVVDIATKNSERLSNLIDDVLDVQKIEAGEMSYSFKILDVRDLVEDAVASNEGYAARYNVTLEYDPLGEAPLLIEGDEKRLMQVMSNMISNAAKFSHEGGTVTVGCRQQNGKIRIFVQDRGYGIPAGCEDKVFDRFSQVDSSDRRSVSGSGLGMNISKEIVDHHKGNIAYDSTLGEGTTFYVEFPEVLKFN